MNFIKKYNNIGNRLIILTSISCFIVFCSVILNFPPIDPIWNFFGDPADYIAQSQISLWSKDFYMPSPHLGFSPRPFTVPLFYKMVDSNPEKIVLLQKIMHCIGVFVFVNTVLLLFSKKIIQILALPLLYLFFTWWVIVGFTDNLLSESLSMTFLFLWLASLILCIHFKNRYALIFVFLVSILFSFTRDTWPYIILLTYIFLFFFYFRNDKVLKKYFLMLSIYGVIIFLFQSHTAQVGERYKIPVYNTLATRIAKNTEYVNWFKKKGMPLADSLIINSSNLNPEIDADQMKIYMTYKNPNYLQLHKWILDKGKNTYLLFMLVHPSYFFLADQSNEEVDRIFQITGKYYIKAYGYYLQVEKILPFFTLNYLLYSTIMLISLFYIFKFKKHLMLFPVLLIIMFVINAFLSYNADTFEVKRHLFITQIMIQLISILVTFCLIDILVNKIVVVYNQLKSPKSSAIN